MKGTTGKRRERERVLLEGHLSWQVRTPNKPHFVAIDRGTFLRHSISYLQTSHSRSSPAVFSLGTVDGRKRGRSSNTVRYHPGFGQLHVVTANTPYGFNPAIQENRAHNTHYLVLRLQIRRFKYQSRLSRIVHKLGRSGEHYNFPSCKSPVSTRASS